jgi:hypothetical protein
MKLISLEIVDAYLVEQNGYGSDFKALILRICARKGEDIAKTLSLTGFPPQTQ